jgi:hypothetical protein
MSNKFMMLGKSKFVHVVRTKAQDLKAKGGSECQQVRKYQVAGTIPKGKGLSPEAAAALDPCPACEAADAIALAVKGSTTPEERKAAAADRAAEVRDRAAGKKPRKAAKAKKVAKPKKETKAKTPKEPKKPSMTKSGPRSVVSGVEDGAKAKAELLAAFGDEHGWSSKLAKDKDTGHWVLTSKKGSETIHTYFIDGKYDVGRHAEIVVGDWSGKLRGAHAVRRQMSMEGRDRPHPEPGKGRSGPRAKAKDAEVVPEDESPEDARRRVPFSMDDPEAEIIERIKGKTIKWRNGVSNSVEEAWLPGEWHGKKRDKIKIIDHPKTGKRMLNFFTVESIGEHGENYGPERTVYLDKIVRVVG